mmetsp:Transcript_6200/g.5623  ORF Transcript_6200/g.5623 Transcript_6200/m.5623 type:complete len:80 (-) Transcript_6200:1101-1340(-)
MQVPPMMQMDMFRPPFQAYNRRFPQAYPQNMFRGNPKFNNQGRGGNRQFQGPRNQGGYNHNYNQGGRQHQHKGGQGYVK